MASFVQTLGGNGGVYGAGKPITVTAAVPVGDMVAVACLNTAALPTGVSDSRSNTYAAAVTWGNNMWNALYYSVLTTALQVNDTITPAFVSGVVEVEAAQFTTIQASPLDKTVTKPGGSGTAMDSGATATLSQASEVVIGIFDQLTVGTAATAGTGYTLIDSQNISGGTGERLTWVYKDVASTAAATAVATASTSTVWDGGAATFKTAAAVVIPDIVMAQR